MEKVGRESKEQYAEKEKMEINKDGGGRKMRRKTQKE